MAKCKSCDSEIVWVKTIYGKNMPVNADSIDTFGNSLQSLGTLIFDSKQMISHYATCPDSILWRNKKGEVKIKDKK